MAKKKREHSNCPYYGSPNCDLGMSDFFVKQDSALSNPLKSLAEKPEYKEHQNRLKGKQSSGKF